MSEEKPDFNEGDSITIFLKKEDAAALNRNGFIIRPIFKEDIFLHDKACELAFP